MLTRPPISSLPHFLFSFIAEHMHILTVTWAIPDLFSIMVIPHTGKGHEIPLRVMKHILKTQPVQED